MLALGRALGETAAVLIIISPAYDIKPRILEAGTQTISALIAGNFGEATKAQLSALLTAGFVLFLITIIVNTDRRRDHRTQPQRREHGDLAMTARTRANRADDRSAAARQCRARCGG